MIEDTISWMIISTILETVNLETYSSVPVTALRGKERPRAVNDTTVRAAFKCVPKKDVNRKCLNIETLVQPLENTEQLA